MKPTTRQWLAIAVDDLDAAQVMLDSGRYLYAGFEAQQSVEKALKAVIQEAVRVPPKIHDLVTLAHEADLNDEGIVANLAVLSPYYIATRYPRDRERIRASTTQAVAERLIQTAKEVLAWATTRLTSSGS